MANNPTGSGLTQDSHLSNLPQELSYNDLKKITNNFSQSQVVGNPGALGTVYKGNLEGGSVIAVKKHEGNAPGTRDIQAYRQNVLSIMDHSNNNVVKLLAFCVEVLKDVTVRVDKDYFTGDIVETLFCYEYFPNGNLHTHLFGNQAIDIDWTTRFKIIKGICQGLRSLHKSPAGVILHLNLKPQNILLDENMVPKITDFVYSRILGPEQTRKNTISTVGSAGYKAPELTRGELSRKTDIYALGLMILEITTRERNSHGENEESARDYINKLEVKWYPTDRRENTIVSEFSDLNFTCQKEVELCVNIGLQCVKPGAKDRPTIEDIARKLNI